MVKKLIKYDFASFMRLLLPVQLILLGIAALNRFIQLFETEDSTIYNIIFTSSVVLYVIAIIVCLLLTTIVGIVRFYQGMYSNEGYLSHTLPVTPTQHILSKLIVTTIFELGSVFAVFVSLCVATLGEFNIELFKAGSFLLGKAYEGLGFHLVLYIIEAVVYLLTAELMGMLMLYFCISMGQLAKKKKILLAFGVFFGLYFLGQVCSTIIIIFVTLNNELVESIAEWAGENYIAFAHIVFGVSFTVTAVLGIVYFLLNRFIMSKKLNLT